MAASDGIDVNRARNSDTRDALLEIAAVLWASRWIVVSTVICCAIAAAVVARSVAPRYTASVLLSPVSNRASSSELGGGLASAASELSGIASLAGISLSTADSAKAVAVATLQSEALTERYIHDNNLLPVLFSGQWNHVLGEWKGSDQTRFPTPWMGNAYFKKHVRKVTEDAKTGLVTLSVTWTDPKLAAQWANGLVRLTNDYMRDNAIGESERDIAYLSGEAAKTSVVELRNAIYQLMETEIRQDMLAKGSEEYALKVIDPAAVPESPSFPQTILWILGGTAMGVVLGAIIAVIRDSFRYSRARTRGSSHNP